MTFKVIGTASRLEVSFYFTTWIFSVLYAIYSFTRISKSYFLTYDDKYGDFHIIVGSWMPKKDAADAEWESICYLIKTLQYWFIAYLITTEVLRHFQFDIKVFQLFQILFPLCFLVISYGWICIGFILLQIIMFCLAGKLHKKSFIWIACLLCLLVITIFKKATIVEEFLFNIGLTSQEINILLVTLSWINLRCTNFYLENVPGNFFTSLAYVLYFPTLFTGPLLSYKDFLTTYKSANFSALEVRIKQLIVNLLRCTFWLLFTEVSLHYIYVNATAFQPDLIKNMDIWAICGYGYTMGQFFHLKYVVSYGFATTAATFDNVTVPRLPRCIGRIHLYSDMWKYFDPGLYEFLVKYIYKPLRIKTGINKLLASLFCFVFVYVWHGVENFILIWACFNYFGICMEYVSEQICRKYLERKKQLTRIQLRRLNCVLASPLLCMSAVSNFYFFAGTEVGNAFVNHLVTESAINISILWFVLYCCCQVSTELRHFGARKM